MSTKQRSFRFRTLSLILILSPWLYASGHASSPQDKDTPRAQQQATPSSPELVVLIDIHPHQDRVLPLEQALAEEVLHKLEQPGKTFSVIAFSSQAPFLVKSLVPGNEAITAIRSVAVEQTKEENFTVHLSDALNLALDQFKGNTGPNSLLIVSEGNDDFTGKLFKQTILRAQQLGVACHVALVADHPLRGSKSIQIYGFNLRRLAGKTQGQYVEVGDQQENIPRYARTLSDGVLGRGPTRARVHP